MLEPREADIPALFLVFVVLPLLAYVLLGKWSEASKKRERVSLLAQLASEEALRAEAMAVADVFPPVSSSKNGLHACARCSRPATTRCSRCKSVRYWYALILSARRAHSACIYTFSLFVFFLCLMLVYCSHLPTHCT
jgi:hypothetical protein